jgi:hypothetical protein
MFAIKRYLRGVFNFSKKVSVEREPFRLCLKLRQGLLFGCGGKGRSEAHEAWFLGMLAESDALLGRWVTFSIQGLAPFSGLRL